MRVVWWKLSPGESFWLYSNDCRAGVTVITMLFTHITDAIIYINPVVDRRHN